MEKLEQYLQQHDQESHSLSRSRQQRLVPTVKPARIHSTIRPLRHSLPPPPPPPPPASPSRSVQRQYHTDICDRGCSVGQELDSFIAVLKQRATLRAHELRQLRQMLIADLDWECEFNIDTRYCSSRGDVSDEEYQALLLGEPSDQMSGYPAQQQQGSRYSANISSQLPDDSSFDQLDLQRAQSEKRQRIQLLTRSMAQMMQRPAPSTNEVRLSSSSSGQGRRLHRYYPSDHYEEVEEVRMHEAVFEEKSTVSPPPKAPTPIPVHAAAHHHRAAVGIAEQDPAERFLRRRGESIDEVEEKEEDEEDDDSLDLFALASSRTPLRLPRTPNCDPAFS